MHITDDEKCRECLKIPSTDSIKDDQFRKELKSALVIIKNIKDKKIKDFLTTYREDIDPTFEIRDTLLITHFLYKAIEELNNDLIKSNKSYRVDYGCDIGTHFINETKVYWEKCNFYNDGGTLDNLRIDEQMKNLDLLIRACADDDELVLYPETLEETNLFVLFL